MFRGKTNEAKKIVTTEIYNNSKMMEIAKESAVIILEFLRVMCSLFVLMNNVNLRKSINTNKLVWFRSIFEYSVI